MSARRLAGAALVCATLGVAWDASRAFGALGPRYGGTLRLGVTTLPTTLDPALPEDAAARGVLALVHETLVGVGPEGLPTPGLVSSWTASAAGREWTLSLHPAARFHDERPVTADDAVRALRRFLRSPSRAAEWLALGLEGGQAFRDKRSTLLPGVASLDERRLVLRFPEPQALPLAPLASPLAAVTSATGQGCGPFVPTLRLPGRQLTLNAFAGHVRGRPYVDELDVRVASDASALRAEWLGGRLDAALDAALDARPTSDVGARDAANSPVGPDARSTLLLLVLDASRAPFDDEAARAAAMLERAALRPFVPTGEVWSLLLPAGLLASPAAAPLTAARAPVAARVTLRVARDVAPSVSQRVVALLNEAGFDVRTEARRATTTRALGPQARLLAFVPEVAEAGLALHELAALGSPSSEADQALATARLETQLDRRRAWLLAAEQALRQDGTRVPLALLPPSLALGAGWHGLRLDGAGRLAAEDAWREP